MQSRASERLHDQTVDEIKEIEHTKTEDLRSLRKDMTSGGTKTKKKQQKDCRAPGN